MKLMVTIKSTTKFKFFKITSFFLVEVYLEVDLDGDYQVDYQDSFIKSTME